MIKSRNSLVMSCLMTMIGAGLAPASHALDPSQLGQQGQQTISVPSRYVPISFITGVWQIQDTQTGLAASTAAYHTEAEASVVANKMNVDAWKSKRTVVPVNEPALKDGGKRAPNTPEALVQNTPTASISGEAVKDKTNSNAVLKPQGPLPTTGKGNNPTQHHPKPR